MAQVIEQRVWLHVNRGDYHHLSRAEVGSAKYTHTNKCLQDRIVGNAFIPLLESQYDWVFL